MKLWVGRWYLSLRLGRFSTSIVWVTNRTLRNYEAQIASASKRAAARHVRMADRATPPPSTTGWNL